MDDDAVLSNLSTVKGMILDEEKPVTYISLSKDLCLHVNTAKKILSVIVEDIKQNTPTTLLNVSYIISGLRDGNKAATKICSEAQLLTEKQSFKCVFFHHIYAVSTGKPSADGGVFMTINRFEDFSLCPGLIKNISCAKRSSDEIVSLKSNSQHSEPEAKAVPEIKVKVEKKKVNELNDEPVAKLQGTKSESTIKMEVTSPKKDSSNNKQNSSKSSKGIAGFFTKSNSAPQPKITSAVPKEATKAATKDTTKNKKSETDILVEKMETEDLNIKIEKVTPNGKGKKQSKQNGKSSSEKLDKIKKTAKVDKKRKRLLHVSDSESDDEGSPFASDSVTNQPEEQMDYDSADEIPPTPTVNTVKITSGIVNPKKRRKIVDKTYTDDEGYILTKKVEVYESCSENEDDVSSKENKANEISKENKNVEVSKKNKVVEIKTEISPKDKKQAPKTGKKKISPPQKGKQATLTNFFKKV